MSLWIKIGFCVKTQALVENNVLLPKAMKVFLITGNRVLCGAKLSARQLLCQLYEENRWS